MGLEKAIKAWIGLKRVTNEVSVVSKVSKRVRGFKKLFSGLIRRVLNRPRVELNIWIKIMVLCPGYIYLGAASYNMFDLLRVNYFTPLYVILCFSTLLWTPLHIFTLLYNAYFFLKLPYTSLYSHTLSFPTLLYSSLHSLYTSLHLTLHYFTLL